MAISGSRFTEKTLTKLVELLPARRDAAARSAEKLHCPTAEALDRRAVSDHFESDPFADSDAERSRVMAERAELSVLEIASSGYER